MPLYPSEIFQYLTNKDPKLTPHFLIIDCRIKKRELLPKSIQISKFVLEDHEVIFFKNLKKIKNILKINSFLKKN